MRVYEKVGHMVKFLESEIDDPQVWYISLRIHSQYHKDVSSNPSLS